jgi:hypothetical protein
MSDDATIICDGPAAIAALAAASTSVGGLATVKRSRRDGRIHTTSGGQSPTHSGPAPGETEVFDFDDHGAHLRYVYCAGCALSNLNSIRWVFALSSLVSLDLSSNRFRTLGYVTQWAQLQSLRQLFLHNNFIEEADVIVAPLRLVPSITHLTVHGNPAALTGCRAVLLNALPQLKILDEHIIADVERLDFAPAAKRLHPRFRAFSAATHIGPRLDMPAVNPTVSGRYNLDGSVAVTTLPITAPDFDRRTRHLLARMVAEASPAAEIQRLWRGYRWRRLHPKTSGVSTNEPSADDSDRRPRLGRRQAPTASNFAGSLDESIDLRASIGTAAARFGLVTRSLMTLKRSVRGWLERERLVSAAVDNAGVSSLIVTKADLPYWCAVIARVTRIVRAAAQRAPNESPAAKRPSAQQHVNLSEVITVMESPVIMVRAHPYALHRERVGYPLPTLLASLLVVVPDASRELRSRRTRDVGSLTAYCDAAGVTRDQADRLRRQARACLRRIRDESAGNSPDERSNSPSASLRRSGGAGRLPRTPTRSRRAVADVGGRNVDHTAIDVAAATAAAKARVMPATELATIVFHEPGVIGRVVNSSRVHNAMRRNVPHLIKPCYIAGDIARVAAVVTIQAFWRGHAVRAGLRVALRGAQLLTLLDRLTLSENDAATRSTATKRAVAQRFAMKRCWTDAYFQFPWPVLTFYATRLQARWRASLSRRRAAFLRQLSEVPLHVRLNIEEGATATTLFISGASLRQLLPRQPGSPSITGADGSASASHNQSAEIALDAIRARASQVSSVSVAAPPAVRVDDHYCRLVASHFPEIHALRRGLELGTRLPGDPAAAARLGVIFCGGPRLFDDLPRYLRSVVNPRGHRDDANLICNPVDLLTHETELLYFATGRPLGASSSAQASAATAVVQSTPSSAFHSTVGGGPPRSRSRSPLSRVTTLDAIDELNDLGANAPGGGEPRTRSPSRTPTPQVTPRAAASSNGIDVNVSHEPLPTSSSLHVLPQQRSTLRQSPSMDHLAATAQSGAFVSHPQQSPNLLSRTQRSQRGSVTFGVSLVDQSPSEMPYVAVAPAHELHRLGIILGGDPSSATTGPSHTLSFARTLRSRRRAGGDRTEGGGKPIKLSEGPVASQIAVVGPGDGTPAERLEWLRGLVDLYPDGYLALRVASRDEAVSRRVALAALTFDVTDGSAIVFEPRQQIQLTHAANLLRRWWSGRLAQRRLAERIARRFPSSRGPSSGDAAAMASPALTGDAVGSPAKQPSFVSSSPPDSASARRDGPVTPPLTIPRGAAIPISLGRFDLTQPIKRVFSAKVLRDVVLDVAAAAAAKDSSSAQQHGDSDDGAETTTTSCGQGTPNTEDDDPTEDVVLSGRRIPIRPTPPPASRGRLNFYAAKWSPVDEARAAKALVQAARDAQAASWRERLDQCKTIRASRGRQQARIAQQLLHMEIVESPRTAAQAAQEAMASAVLASAQIGTAIISRPATAGPFHQHAVEHRLEVPTDEIATGWDPRQRQQQGPNTAQDQVEVTRASATPAAVRPPSGRPSSARQAAMAASRPSSSSLRRTQAGSHTARTPGVLSELGSALATTMSRPASASAGSAHPQRGVPTPPASELTSDPAPMLRFHTDTETIVSSNALSRQHGFAHVRVDHSAFDAPQQQTALIGPEVVASTARAAGTISTPRAAGRQASPRTTSAISHGDEVTTTLLDPSPDNGTPATTSAVSATAVVVQRQRAAREQVRRLHELERAEYRKDVDDKLEAQKTQAALERAQVQARRHRDAVRHRGLRAMHVSHVEPAVDQRRIDRALTVGRRQQQATEDHEASQSLRASRTAAERDRVTRRDQRLAEKYPSSVAVVTNDVAATVRNNDDRGADTYDVEPSQQATVMDAVLAPSGFLDTDFTPPHHPAFRSTASVLGFPPPLDPQAIDPRGSQGHQRRRPSSKSIGNLDTAAVPASIVSGATAVLSPRRTKSSKAAAAPPPATSRVGRHGPTAHRTTSGTSSAAAVGNTPRPPSGTGGGVSTGRPSQAAGLRAQSRTPHDLGTPHASSLGGW